LGIGDRGMIIREGRMRGWSILEEERSKGVEVYYE
jgi:hypothetical protein